MAVKIIKEGNTKKVFEGRCNDCGCEFEYEKEDTSDSSYAQSEKRCTEYIRQGKFFGLSLAI